MTFVLDERLERDSAFVCDLQLSQVRLLHDARFVWLMLVPRVGGASELFDLNPDDAAQLMREIRDVSSALKQMTRCTKINVGALGNKVRQLHVHVIARSEGDAAWPGAVWDKGPNVPYTEDTRAMLIEKLQAVLPSPRVGEGGSRAFARDG